MRKCLISVNVALPLPFSLPFSPPPPFICERACLCVFGGVDLLFLFFCCVYSRALHARTFGITNKRRQNWPWDRFPARVLSLHNLFLDVSLPSAIKGETKWGPPTPSLHGPASSSSAWRAFRPATCDWRGPARLFWLMMLITGDGNRMTPTIRDLRAAEGWRELVVCVWGGLGVWHLMLSICVCTADKWWIEHMRARTPTGLTSCLLSPASFSFELLPAMEWGGGIKPSVLIE